MRACLHCAVSRSIIGIACLWLSSSAVSQALEAGGTACHVNQMAPNMIPGMAINPEAMALVGLFGVTLLLLRKKH